MGITTVGWRASLPNYVDVVGGIASRGTLTVAGGELCTLDARALTHHPRTIEGTNVLPQAEDAIFLGDLNRRVVIRGMAASAVTMAAHTGSTIGAVPFEWCVFCSNHALTISAFALTNTTSRLLPAFELQRDAQQIRGGIGSTGVYMPCEVELPRSARYLYALARVWMPQMAGAATANPGTSVEIAPATFKLLIF